MKLALAALPLALIADFRADMTGHFDDVLAANGLRMIESKLALLSNKSRLLTSLLAGNF